MRYSVSCFWDKEKLLICVLGIFVLPLQAWLDPDSLPSGRARDCDICGEPLQFLLQVPS